MNVKDAREVEIWLEGWRKRKSAWGACFRCPQPQVFNAASPRQDKMRMAVMIYVKPGNYKYFGVHTPIRASPPPCEEVLCSHFTEEQSKASRGCGERSSCLHLQYVGFFTASDLFLHTRWASSCLQALQMPSRLTGQHFLCLGKED